MISNEHVQVLQTLFNNGYIDPEATDTDIQNLLNDGHTLRQLRDVTEEQARIAQQVIDTGEPFFAQTAEGPINIQLDEADDYLNEALRLWLGVMFWENTNTNFTHITNPTILRMVEQYGAGLANQDGETHNPPEQDVDIIDIPEDTLADIHGELFDLAHLEERQSLLRRLDAFARDTLEGIIERYNDGRLPAGNYTRGISNEWWNAALDAFTGIYEERNANLTAEAFRAALDQLTELERMRIREDEAGGEDDIDLEDAEEEPAVGVVMYRQLLDEYSEGYDTLDILVDWYLANSRPDTLSRISTLDYASVIGMFEGLEEYQRNLYRENNPEDLELIDFDIHITPETLAEYLNHEISLAAPDDKDILKPRTINSIIMKGW